MFRLVLATLLTFAPLVARQPQRPAAQPAPQQQQPSSTPHQAERKHGAIFRSEIDALIARLDALATAERPHRRPLGGSSILANARILLAMARCHRHYHKSDGPVVRPTIDFLLAQQRDDGRFGDLETSAWVVEALQNIDPAGPSASSPAMQRWVEAHAPVTKHFETWLDTVRQSKGLPQDAMGKELSLVKQWTSGAAPWDTERAAEVLVGLVVCQVANLRLDAAEVRSQGSVARLLPAQERGLAWLFAQQHDGVFGEGKNRVALSAIGLMALQTKPAKERTADEQAAIVAGLRWLIAQQNEDGSFGDSLPNYTTCTAIGALRTFDDPAAKAAVQKAQRAVLAFQNCEQNGYAPSDRDYGSIGYGGSSRGDLSNTQFALQALTDSGLGKGHEALQRAVTFLQRTQNRRASNDHAGAAPDPDNDGALLDTVPGDDGGASYYPGNSTAGYVVRPDGKVEPRSYGSMTYALLKAYTLAGLPRDDARVQAAIGWLQANWRLDVNPGVDPALGPNALAQGLFYYYLLMAQALGTAGIDTLQVGERRVDWRLELHQHLTNLQRADGSWINDQNGRWMESSPLLCTCYALLAMAP